MSGYAESASLCVLSFLSMCVDSVIFRQPGRVLGWVVGLPDSNWCDRSHYSCPQRLALPSSVKLCQGFGLLDTELT